MKTESSRLSKGDNSGLGRRQFIAGAACTLPVALSSSPTAAQAAPDAEAIDFARTFCHYEADGGQLWVRVNVDCYCEVFNLSTGESDEYLLSVRTQTGLRTEPLSDILDPGYDFWFIFSKRFVYIRRTLASSYGDSSSRVPIEKFASPGWRIHRVPATPLTTGAELRDALRDWHSIVARTEFMADDGVHGYRIEYPVKWADGNPNASFRVETGPVVLLDPEQFHVGSNPQYHDFQWAYLDYRSNHTAKVFVEQPTPVLSGTQWKSNLGLNPQLLPEQRKAIEEHLFEAWDAPISLDTLQKMFQIDHYSTVEQRKMHTELFSLG
ncbi:MAG: hypothetical protein MK179_01435 [Pirellulaceae bacterium]|nr:hypothetical protein [Pirellulaceae bacterium]